MKLHIHDTTLLSHRPVAEDFRQMLAFRLDPNVWQSVLTAGRRYTESRLPSDGSDPSPSQFYRTRRH